MAAKVRELRPGSSKDTSQKKTTEEISKEATLEEAQNVAPNQTVEELSSGDEETLAKKRRETSACAKSSHRRIARRVKPVDDATGKEKSKVTVELLEASNGENRQLVAEASARQEEI
ncbi:hypothetical protein Adt_46554 [Abeliophyllum distichum]|uniref:Uncharacterized protein n=1 Tax=Abeliophyllum distichum TaxID=126358 RepID=A0ABD1NZC4_9LAMI